MLLKHQVISLHLFTLCCYEKPQAVAIASSMYYVGCRQSILLSNIKSPLATIPSNGEELSLPLHFSGRSGLAYTRIFPFWILLELRIMKVVVTTGAIRRAKPQWNNHHQQTKHSFLTGQMPFLSPNQQCQSTEGKSTGEKLRKYNPTKYRVTADTKLQ